MRKTRGGGETAAAQALRLTQAALPDQFNQSTLEGNSSSLDVVAWPETTAKLLRFGGDYQGLDFVQIQQTAIERRFSFLVGAHVKSTGIDGNVLLWNQGVLVGPAAPAKGSSKQRVVPFGERAPFSEYLPFLAHLAPKPPVQPEPGQLLEFARDADPVVQGSTNSSVASSRVPMGVLICFESCFMRPARQRVREGAKVLWVLTNDEWFAGTNAPFEHATMAAMRAVENDVPVVQVANGGYSFVVDRRGRFVSLPATERSTIDRQGPNVVKTSLHSSAMYPLAALSSYGEAKALKVKVPLP
jgi:apolipoprotein N-acyltransferase